MFFLLIEPSPSKIHTFILIFIKIDWQISEILSCIISLTLLTINCDNEILSNLVPIEGPSQRLNNVQFLTI
jgi:hypothetical protein